MDSYLTYVKIPTYQDHSMPHSRVVKHFGHLFRIEEFRIKDFRIKDFRIEDFRIEDFLKEHKKMVTD